MPQIILPGKNGAFTENLNLNSNPNQQYLEIIKKSERPTNNNSNNKEPTSESKSKVKSLPWMNKLNLSFPYFFKDEINWDLVDTLADETTSWLENIFQSSSKECYKFLSDFQSKARDIMIMPGFTAPKSWDEKTAEGFSKHLLWAKIFACVMIHDDMIELQIGNAGFFKFVQVNAQVLHKIFSLQYKDVEGVIEDILQGLKDLNPDFGQLFPTIIIWYEVAMEFQKKFGITKEQMEHLAKVKRREISYLAWCGQEDQAFLGNLSLRRQCRENTIQVHSVLEFLLLLNGCFPTKSLREDIHFLRFERLSCEMVAMVNDLLSAAKELATESYPDNLVALYMHKNGMSLSQSYMKVVDKHNEKLSEFQQLYHFIQSDDFSPLDSINKHGEKYKQEKSEEASETAAVVELYASLTGSSFQSHFMMKRYHRYFT